MKIFLLHDNDEDGSSVRFVTTSEDVATKVAEATGFTAEAVEVDDHMPTLLTHLAQVQLQSGEVLNLRDIGEANLSSRHDLHQCNHRPRVDSILDNHKAKTYHDVVTAYGTSEAEALATALEYREAVFEKYPSLRAESLGIRKGFNLPEWPNP